MGIILITAIGWLARIITWLIIIRSLLSWFNIRQSNILLDLLYTLTDPLIIPVRNLMNRITGTAMMLDFSPIIAILLVYGVEILLTRVIVAVML